MKITGLRHVAHALLVGPDAKQGGEQPLRVCASRPSEGRRAYDTGAVQLAAGVKAQIGFALFVAPLSLAG